MYISAHLWPSSTYTKECRPLFTRFNLLTIEGADDLYGWKDGSVDVPPLQVSAGSKSKVILELDWDDMLAREVTKDFSLVVYGSDGPVSISPQILPQQASFETILRESASSLTSSSDEDQEEAMPH